MVKELKLNPIKLKKEPNDKNQIVSSDDQFIIGKEYELKNPILLDQPIQVWYQTKDENGKEFYIPEWCFDLISEESIRDQESEIKELEKIIKQKKEKLRLDKEKFFSSNLHNKNGKLNIIKRNIKETYTVNDDYVDGEREMTNGIDFGSFFGAERASTSTYYIWMNELINWFEKNIDKYGDRILVTDKPVIDFDWSKEKIVYRTLEDNRKKLRDQNFNMLSNIIKKDQKEKSQLLQS